MLPITMATADQTPSCRARVRAGGVPEGGGPVWRADMGWDSGQGGIRTHDTREGIPVFETGSFSHSDTCPGYQSTAAYGASGPRSPDPGLEKTRRSVERPGRLVYRASRGVSIRV